MSFHKKSNLVINDFSSQWLGMNEKESPILHVPMQVMNSWTDKCRHFLQI